MVAPPFLAKLFGGPVKEIIGAVGGVIDNLHTSGEEKAAAKFKLAELEHALTLAEMQVDTEIAKVQGEVIRAEAQSQSGLARSWRPVTALVFVFIIFNYYVLVPYANAFGARVPSFDIPPGLWAVLTTMIGGYTVGRSAEKIWGKER